MNKVIQMKQATVKPNDKKLLLINIGTAIFTQKGFSITSLDEIVEIAEIPKGSFYYYFKSKDEFAIEVIKNYGIYFSKKLQRILSNDKKSPLERLGQEMATLEERFRIELLNVIADWRDQVRLCIDLAKAQREIKTTIDSSELANFFWCAWEGAVLCSKLELSTQPLNIVSRLFITELLQPF